MVTMISSDPEIAANETLKAAADRMRHDLFEPLGLNVPNVPMRVSGDLPFWANGVTRHAPFTHEPWLIEISPRLSAVEAAGVLAHEMTHAALPFEASHGPQFEAVVRKLGLDGPAEATTVGEPFRQYYSERLAPIFNRLKAT